MSRGVNRDHIFIVQARYTHNGCLRTPTEEIRARNTAEAESVMRRALGCEVSPMVPVHVSAVRQDMVRPRCPEYA